MEDRGTTDLILEVLGAISATHLEVLSIEYSPKVDRERIVPIVPIAYPALRELSVGLWCFQPESFVRSFPAPQLERLQIRKHVNFPTDFGQQLGRLFPRVTHLHLAIALYRDNRVLLPTFLRSYCKLERNSKTHVRSEAESLPEDPIVFVPTTLRMIIVTFERLYLNLDHHHFMVTEHFFSQADIYWDIRKDKKSYGVLGLEVILTDRTKAIEDQPRTLLVCSVPDVLSTTDIDKHNWDLYKSMREEWMQRATGSGSGCWM
ncbi:hypothetical protein EIP91_011201 [Steccherinum ochraceum]|uniref:Uncharacterized protein n=1 Tax=Steccherinum ochraceum TaxID=92696 RepID=A0A4R0R8C4_9APHY|nr:hypothetical protein EIP91_011201 [Steccherinum ochraceum]